jgi:ABC-2 type transport system permease protein
MARLLVQLKLRLLLNALRSATTAKVSFVISTIFAVLFAAGVFAALALLRGNAASVDETTVIFTTIAFGWLILPIFVFGLDGTLDPASLALYPLRTRPLVVGLLAASATGAWPVANLIGLIGVVIGLASGAFGVFVAVLAVLLQVLFCLTLARFVTTSLSRMLRSRRGKDLAAFLIIPIYALYQFFTQVIPAAASGGSLTAASFAAVDSWLRWLPPGLAAHAIRDASDGRPGTALLRLALLAAIVATLGWLWIRSLSRALVSSDTTTQSSRVRGAALPLGRYGVRGAAAARCWIYQRREPMQLVMWAICAVIMFAVSARAALGPAHVLGLIPASAIFGAAFAGYFHANVAGISGPPFITEALALTGRREWQAYFSGQNIAIGVIGVPLFIAVSFGLAVAAKHPGYGFIAAAVVLAGIGAALGLSNIFSVALPFPLEKRPGNPLRQAAQGYTVYGIIGVFGILIGTAIAVSPVLVVIVLTNPDRAAVRFPVLLVCAAGYGLALAWAGVQIASRTIEARLPDLCQIALRSKL